MRLRRRTSLVVQICVEPLYVLPGTAQGRTPLELAQSNQHGLAGEEIEQGARHYQARPGVAAGAEVHGQDVRLGKFTSGTLVEDVEAPDRRYLISPELDANGLWRSKGEQVQQSPTNSELPDLFDQRHALESSFFQGRQEFCEAVFMADTERESEASQAIWHGCPLL